MSCLVGRPLRKQPARLLRAMIVVVRLRSSLVVPIRLLMTARGGRVAADIIPLDAAECVGCFHL